MGSFTGTPTIHQCLREEKWHLLPQQPLTANHFQVEEGLEELSTGSISCWSCADNTAVELLSPAVSTSQLPPHPPARLPFCLTLEAKGVIQITYLVVSFVP